jgi:hypothetical protein
LYYYFRDKELFFSAVINRGIKNPPHYDPGGSKKLEDYGLKVGRISMAFEKFIQKLDSMSGQLCQK